MKDYSNTKGTNDTTVKSFLLVYFVSFVFTNPLWLFFNLKSKIGNLK